MGLSKLTLAALALMTGFQSVSAQNCSNVHIIVARASTEPIGTGIIGVVAKQVQSQVSGTDIVAVDYPATLDNYVTSQTAGVVAMTKMVTDYAVTCPNSKLVLMGYSQGAQVSADVACGTTENGFPATESLPSVVSDKIAAIVLMGDPSFTVGQPFDRGNATIGGIFHRDNVTTTCAAVVSKMVSYCDSGDTYCDSAGNSEQGIKIHIGYVQEYGTNATDFVVSKLKTPVPVQVSAGLGGGRMASGAAVVGVLLVAVQLAL